MTIESKREQGASLINMMLAIALMTTAIGGALNTYTFLISKESAAEQDETYNKAVRIGEIAAARISRGGAYIADRNNSTLLHGGIKVCTLNSQLNSCGTYNPAANRTCIALTTKVGYGALATFEMKGIRMANGQLQQKSTNNLDDQDLKNFNLVGYCQGATNWVDLHSPAELRIKSFSLCNFNSQNANALMNDYESTCPSILKNNKNQKTFWMLVMQIERPSAQSSPVSFSRIIPILNATEIRTL